MSTRLEKVTLPQVDELTVNIEHLGAFVDPGGWDHDRYRFRYRNPANDRTFQVTFRAGMAYGPPKPHDALAASFLDVRYLEDNADWSTEEGRQAALEGERIEARHRKFLGEAYDAWRQHSEEVWDS